MNALLGDHLVSLQHIPKYMGVKLGSGVNQNDFSYWDKANKNHFKKLLNGKIRKYVSCIK